VFFFLSKLLDVFLSPFTWALLFVVLAIPWRKPRRRSSWKRTRLFGALGLALLYVFSIEPVANGLLHHLEHATTSTFRPDVVYDAVVLLGGVGDERVALETGQPAYNDNVERLIATHRLLADGNARVAIVSGAPENPDLAEHSEARVLARQIAQWGVDPSRVIIEDKARNTHENAVYSQRVARERGFERVLIVTSAFHMRRAEECFAAVGMKVDTLIVDYRAHGSKGPGEWSFLPRAGNLADSSRTLREMAGLHIYRLQGYAKPAR
jgi:uncharacterized SAM-binding protein YcdF (DUF218 family)